MKLYRKIRKLAYPLTYRRAWRRAQRSIFRLPLGPLRASIDPERLREIQQRYASLPVGYVKYASVDPWLRLNRERVQDLKLLVRRRRACLISAAEVDFSCSY